MICATLTADPVPVWTPAASQPADVSGCDAVILTGADSSAVDLFSYPSAADASTAYVLGFTLVVLPYLAAVGCGHLLGMLDRR